MPIYEYMCINCENTIDRLEPMATKNVGLIQVCDGCGELQNFRKVISGSNFRLVGSGWAKDGYSNFKK